MCWHYDQTTGKNVKEVNILSALIQYGEVAIPMAFVGVKKMVTYYDMKTKRSNGWAVGVKMRCSDISLISQ